MIADKIKAYLDKGELSVDEAMLKSVAELSSHNFKRQFMETRLVPTGQPDPNWKLTLSSAGRCARSLAYKKLGYIEAGKDIDARALLNFYYGDTIELMVIHLAQLAGCKLESVGLNQKTVVIDVAGVQVEGHPDGFYVDDAMGERYLVECKSMNDYAFTDFDKEGTIDDSYLAQVNVYMKAEGLTTCIFIAVNKQNGVMAERVVNRDENIIATTMENLKDVIEATSECLPRRAHGANMKGKLPWNCLYCAFWQCCWLKAEKKVEKGRYVLYTEIENLL